MHNDLGLFFKITLYIGRRGSAQKGSKLGTTYKSLMRCSKLAVFMICPCIFVKMNITDVSFFNAN